MSAKEKGMIVDVGQEFVSMCTGAGVHVMCSSFRNHFLGITGFHSKSRMTTNITQQAVQECRKPAIM